MKFFATACFFLAAAMAAPHPGGYTAPGDYSPATTSYGNGGNGGFSGNNGGNNGINGLVCPPGLYSNPQCCVVDVLGLADLDCKTPSSASSSSDFKSSCGKISRQAKCCTLPVAGQGVLCQDAI